ncbi:MAG: response regulator [Halobacteriovoraceae bacterium]|nr:response regulator [Halobacteriovoraceae bacterium]
MVILIVDDDSDIKGIIKETLVDNNNSVTFIEAEDSYEAMGLCQDFADRINLIICDFKMPNGSGDILFQYWSENLPHLPFVLYSSEVLKAREEFEKIGDTSLERLGFVEKSTGVTALLCEIERLCKYGFTSVPTKAVTPTKPLLAPLYIGVNNKKIIRLCHEGDYLDQEKIDSFKEKGVITLFTPLENAVDLGIRFPLFPLHKVTGSESSPKDVFKKFRDIHEELLNPLVNKKRSLELTLDNLARCVVTNLPAEEVFSQFKSNNFFKTNYVINHSLLVATLALMGLEELGLGSEGTRKTLVQAILIHDLLMKDSEAMEFDLISKMTVSESSSLEIRRSKYLLKIQEFLKKFNMGQDISIIVESLVVGLHDPDFIPRGNHKLSSLALAMHKISNELYLSSFTKKFTTVDFEKFSLNDKQVLNTIEKVIKV